MTEKTTDITEHLPYFSYESDMMILKDGRVVVGCSIDGIIEETWSAKDYEVFSKLLESGLKKLSAGTCITKTDIYYPNKKKVSSASTFIEKKAEEYFKNRNNLSHQSYMYLTFLPGSISKATALSNTFTSENDSNANLNTKELNKLKKLAEKEFDEFQNILSGEENLKITRLDDYQLELLAYQYFNLDFEQKDFQLYCEIDNTSSSQLSVGNKLVNNITLKGQATNIEYSNLKSYTEKGKIPKSFIYPLTHELGVPHILTQTMQILVKEEALSGFDKEVEIVGGMMGIIPRLQKLSPRNDQITEFLEEIRLREVGLVNFGLQVSIFSETPQEQKKNIDITKSAFNKINHSTYTIESFDNANLFFAAAPGNASEIYKSILMPMDVAIAHYNFTKEFKGDDTGVTYCNRHGALIKFNYDHVAVDKKNENVVGPTRSGKSFTVGHRIIDFIEKNGIVIILDKGGTYKNLIQNLGGKYFENSDKNPIRINPLLIQKTDGEYQLSKDNMIYLKTFFMMIWKNKDRGEKPTNAEESGLMWVISSYYKAVNNELKTDSNLIPRIPHFFDWYKEFLENSREEKEFVEYSSDFDFTNFLNVLKPFAHGIYAETFDVVDNKLLTDEKLICFDLAGLEKDPFMFRIMSTVIIQLIMDYIKLYPKVKKWIPIDEAWSLFSGDMGDFIAYMFRTILKANGKSTVITQSASDFEKCEIGQILIDNAGILTILNHAGQDYEKLQDVFSLTSHELDLVKSIRKMKGREHFIRHQDLRSQVVNLEAHPHEYAILTSQPDERNHLLDLIDKYGTIQRATDEWVKDFNAGAIIKN